MSDLLTISLHNVRFRAFHGVHPEEREKGNDFVVNLDVSYKPGIHTVVSLQDTIDYAELFEIINSAMQKPVDLLETLVQTIGYNVYKKYPKIKHISVSVEKLNPPIDQFTGVAAVKLTKTY
jgi:7,8-dihydroneopterin aldolase/epimerase/oxygenase